MNPVAIATSYDPLLVAFSYAIAAAASYTALDVAGRRGDATGSAWWMLAGAATMGLGIWSMHFIGMAAFHMGVPVSYDVGITAASLVFAVLGSYIALWTVAHPVMTRARWAAGSLAMGAAVATMHYTGMAAMHMQAVIVWDPLWFGISGLIAVGASALAMGMAYRTRGESLAGWSAQKLGSALVLGTAIAGMHYAGMQAARFFPAVCAPPTQPTMEVSNLGIAALAFCTLFVMAGSVLSAYKATLQAKQDALTAREAELRLALEELRSADRYKDEFLSIISHELRTPLNFITGFASILADEVAGPLTPAQADHLGKILNGADRMRLLVDDLLDFAKLRSGKFDLAPVPTAYGPLVDEALALLQPLAQRKGLKLVAEHGLTADVVPAIDGQRVTQVLTNLLSNAIKFTDAGEVRVTTAVRGDRLYTAVSDQGVGIPADQLPKLFQRFSQLDMSRTRQAGGTGLGLAISKALVEAHGGEIGVTSQPGVGTTVWYALPLVLTSVVPATEDGLVR